MDVFFFGEETSKVDSKGRIAVPAIFRAPLGWTREKTVEVCIRPAQAGPALDLAPIAFINDLIVRASTPGLMTEEQRTEVRLALPRIRRLTIDEDGRFILPERFKAHAQLDDQAQFVGIGRTFQIWQPANYAAHEAAAQAKLGAIKASDLPELFFLGKGEA
jgi:MraZ protein